MRVSALIVSYNTRDLLLECVASVTREECDDVVVVDNASTDGSADALAAAFPAPAVTLVRLEQNQGFAAAVNLASKRARGDAFLLLNPDATPRSGCIGDMLRLLMVHPRAAAVGSALVYPDGRLQDSAFRFPGLSQVFLDFFPVPWLVRSSLNGRYAQRNEPMRIDHPLGACMLVRRAAWDEVGSLDEGYFMYVEEVDWCQRAARLGWEVWHQPSAVTVHHGGKSTEQQAGPMYVQLWRSRLRYFQRYHGPAYNRALRAIARLGLAAERRRAGRLPVGPKRDERLAALARVRAMVA